MKKQRNMCKFLVLFIIVICCVIGVQNKISSKLFSLEKIMESKIKYLYINQSGEIMIDASNYRKAYSFSEGLAVIESNDYLFGYIDKSGKIAVKPQFQQARNFSEGLAAVEINGRWGFIDKIGAIILEAEYDLVCDFSENLAVVKKDKEEFIINKIGQKLFSLTANNLQLQIYENVKFSNGLIEACSSENNKCGYIDQAGNFIISPQFTEVAPFSEGLARVSVIDEDEEKLGFIDRRGNFVIPPKFNTDGDFRRNSTDFSEGLASLTENLSPTVTDEEKFVYIDKKGKIVLRTDFFYAGSFQEGMAFVYDDKKDTWGFINKSGKLVIQLKYESAKSFSEGLACVTMLD